ncbi:MAG TPA: RecX family transcriptional regulator, partial [Alphaproteobacteria bacterium]|nr:RecX family transcriptional regulator [Alphaproteobacteria bacterium]
MPESGNARPLTAKRLTNIALYYLGRYESSVEQLRKILLRRVLKEKMKGADIPADVEAVVESILSKMIADGYVE